MSIFFSLDMFGQTVPFFEYLPSNTALTSVEQSLFNKYAQDSTIEAAWLMKVNPIQNYLVFDSLRIQLPDLAFPVTFYADGVASRSVNSYSWFGYNLDGSTASISKTSRGVFGTLFLASNMKRYDLSIISTTKSIIRVFLPNHIPKDGPCDDEDDDQVIEETIDEVDSRNDDCGTKTVRILFLHTQAALDANAIVASYASLVIDQLNTASFESGIPQSEAFFVSVSDESTLLPEFMERNTAPQTARDLADFGPANTMRAATFADVVCLFCSNEWEKNTVANGATGSTKGVFVVAQENKNKDHLKMTHGVGHVILGKTPKGHQFCSNCWDRRCTTFDPYYPKRHGYVITINDGDFKLFKTIMADCGSFSIPHRITRWSNPDETYGGLATGTLLTNNAEVIKAKISSIACLVPDPPVYSGSCQPTLSIDGPTCLSPYSYRLFTASPGNSTTTWTKSTDGVVYTSMGTGATINFFNPYPSGTKLRVRAETGTECGNYEVKVENNCFGSDHPQNRNAQIGEQPSFVISPNPNSGYFQILGDTNNREFRLYDLRGIRYDCDFRDGQVNISRLNEGVYFLEIKDSGIKKFVKIIKQ